MLMLPTFIIMQVNGIRQQSVLWKSKLWQSFALCIFDFDRIVADSWKRYIIIIFFVCH